MPSPPDTTASEVQPVAGEARMREIARMLGGTDEGSAGGTSLAHAQALLAAGAQE